MNNLPLQELLMNPWRKAALALLLAGTSAFAEEPDLSRVRDNLNSTTDELSVSTARQKELEQEIAKAVSAEQDVSARLVEAGQGIASLEQALIENETKLQELQDQHTALTAELARKQDVLSELLAALQVLEQNPPPALVVAPDDILEALRGAMMFGAVVPQMRAQASLLVNQLERLASIKHETRQARTNAKTQIASIATAYRELELLQRQKQGESAAATTSLESERKLAARLAKQAQNLAGLMSGLEAAETERQKTMDAEAKRAAEIRQRQLAALAASPSMAKAKGLLEYPVQGQIIAHFGDDNGVGSTMNGLAITARAGLQVRSPVSGRVEFAGPFRSYGQLLIIDAGEGYLVVMAGMDEMALTRGQRVNAGEPVGRMGEGPSSVAIAGKTAASLTPVLYVEFRRNGKPVDSASFWIGARKEARQ